LSPYNREPPELQFAVDGYRTSTEYFWNCVDEKRKECRGKEELNLRVEQMNERMPRVFKIDNFVSEFEAGHIIQQAERFLRRSMVGDGENARQDPSRTSSNTWLAMNGTKVIQSIYRRIGDMLGIDKARMSAEAATHQIRGLHGVASHLEVVRFNTREFYAPHYDNAPNQDHHLHFITFQVVLHTEDLEGGNTDFPHALGDNGFSVPIKEYQAVFWYNLLEDGNVDQASMYQHLPPTKGQYWIFHVSVWDPCLPERGDPRSEHEKIYQLHDEL